MVTYRWSKVNTYFSAKVCTLRICTHLQPICDTFLHAKTLQKITFGVLLDCLFICKFYKMLVLFFAKTWMVFQQNLHSLVQRFVRFYKKTVRFFHPKSCIFAHFLPIRGCFLMFLHCLAVSKCILRTSNLGQSLCEKICFSTPHHSLMSCSTS